jgi:3-deoxy-manno-octulosonate cytidylyltransferase (CMP-KDO synthetase)
MGLREMATERTIVAVPARLQSSRLPNKVLADIGGISMLQRVLEQCALALGIESVILCTDSELLYSKAESWGFSALMTSPDCASGSERIASVVDDLVALAWRENVSHWDGPTRQQRLATTAVINVQGDQPFLNPAVVRTMAAEFLQRNPTPSVMTPVYQLKPGAIHNPNVVKTLLAHDGRALYFSRSALPHVRDVDPLDWHNYATYWGHVGMYGFRADVLAAWQKLPISPLEEVEKLEQLRLIEAGHSISTFVVDGTSLSVDTPEQLEEARLIVQSL